MKLLSTLFISCVFLFTTALQADALDPRIDQVLNYWFGELKSADDYATEKSKIWFGGGESVDNDIRNRFETLVVEASEHKLDNWITTPKGRLALIILVDQFPRNIYRGTPKSFAFDAQAAALTKEGLALGHDKQLFPVERAFFYLPLEHAENVEDQNLSVALFTQLADAFPTQNNHSNLDYAKRHQVIIERFGRFPHRNVILGRPSTCDEIEFLKTPKSSF